MTANIISFTPGVLATNGTYAVTFTGPFSSGQAVTITYRQIGQFLHLEIPALTASAGIAASANSGNILAPNHLPAAPLYKPITVLNNSAILPASGKVEITTSGAINIYLDLLGTAAWGALGNNGWQRFGVSYAL